MVSVPGKCNCSRMAACSWQLLLVLVLCLLTACQPSKRERPYGHVRLGLVKELLASETYLPALHLLVRHDPAGFSVMSTECTLDLSALEVRTAPNGEKIWASPFSASTYSYDGKVLSGPATHDLPYYEAHIDAGAYNGPADTLYAIIGPEKARQWRLKVEPPPDPASRNQGA